jgi:hypothetical protein
MVRYLYQALDTSHHEIRLIRLLPGFFSEDINIQIFHEPLSKSQRPKYEALSYVWGSSDNTRSITVRAATSPLDKNGKPWSRIVRRLGFSSSKSESHKTKTAEYALRPRLEDLGQLHVTLNLLIALKHLRRDHVPRILWVDAICINQEDLRERSSEVGQMGWIYSKADSVIAWLGPSSDNSALALTTLRSLGQDIFDDSKRYSSAVAEGSKTHKLQENPEAIEAKEPEWRAVQDLLCRKWFTRLWVFQEIALSQRAVVVVGFSELSWIDFRSAVRWIGSFVRPITSLSMVLNFDYWKTVIFSVLQASDHDDLSIVAAIRITKFAFCLDPRDRVYGVLSMNEFDLGISPDYSKTKEEVYEEFTRAYLAKFSLLNVLELCELGYLSAKLPSWVPDLSTPNPIQKVAGDDSSGRSKHCGGFTDADRNLHLVGVLADTLTSVRQPVPLTATPSEIIAICQTWEPENILGEVYSGRETMLDAYIKTLTCGFLREDNPPNSGDTPILAECRRPFIERRTSCESGITDSRLLELIPGMLRGRVFATTSLGYIGAFPERAQVGDQVCVALGSSTPLLLRPISGEKHYRLVGSCYVAGLMNGEALLGPLPASWHLGRVDENENRIYVCDENVSTLEDPRLGPLPPGWRICYDNGGKEKDKEGNLNDFYFRHDESDFETSFDPRLDLRNGEGFKRGMQLQEFILV